MSLQKLGGPTWALGSSQLLCIRGTGTRSADGRREASSRAWNTRLGRAALRRAFRQRSPLLGPAAEGRTGRRTTDQRSGRRRDFVSLQVLLVQKGIL